MLQSFGGLTSNGDCSYGSKRPRLDDHVELLKIRRQVNKHLWATPEPNNQYLLER